MIIASVIVKCDPSMVDEITTKINELNNVTTHGVHKEDNLIVLIEAETEEIIEAFTRTIQNEVNGVLGTFPSFIASEDQLDNMDSELLN